ncbi:hypothetical protein [Photorhabdus viridis]
MKINKQLFNLAQCEAYIARHLMSEINWSIAMNYLRLAYEDG